MDGRRFLPCGGRRSIHSSSSHSSRKQQIHSSRSSAAAEYQGSVVGQVNQRRGVILETVGGDTTSVTCEVPLNAMFGYSTDLRSATQGKGTFTMEFARYAIVPKTA